jgi:hypothetical protein
MRRGLPAWGRAFTSWANGDEAVFELVEAQRCAPFEVSDKFNFVMMLP